MKHRIANLLACVLLAGATAHATAAETAPAAAQAPLAEGEIRKVDRAAGKVTIKHGPLPNLGMPAMTMVFRVGDAAWLEQMKAGDRIRFVAEKVDGAFTVVRWETQP